MRLAIGIAAAASLSGCEGIPNVTLKPSTSSLMVTAMAVAPDPTAVEVGSEMLIAGGNAVDAAAAMGLVLTVTLPSRAGLGGGGVCLVSDPDSGIVDRIDFPLRPASPDIDARWRGATPHLARGLFALHANGGRRPWSRVVTPAERVARTGFRVSPLLAADILVHQGVFLNDRAAIALIQTKSRRAAIAGDTLTNPDLAITLGRMRGRGPGSFFEGSQAKDIADAADAAGVSISAADLRAAIPAQSRIESVPSVEGELSAGAAGVGFAVVDNDGRTAACAIGMNGFFGLGLIARGHGFLFAPATSDGFDPDRVAAYTLGGGQGSAACDQSPAAGDNRCPLRSWPPVSNQNLDGR